MKVFITGATGYIGNAVANCFSRAGHEVWGLTRAKEKCDQLELEEIHPVVGSLDNPKAFLDEVQKCQCIVHCAAEYSKRFLELDRKAVEALIQCCRDSRIPRTLLYTSGAWVYGNCGTDTVDESCALKPPSFIRDRVETEKIVLNANSPALRSLVIRPGCVYGKSGGLTRTWFKDALDRDTVRVINNGENIWAMVHVSDLARLYLKAAETPLGGEIFNAADCSRYTVQQCAQAVLQKIGSQRQPENMDMDTAMEIYGPLAEGLALNLRIDSSKAARLLNWFPRHYGFVDGIERYHLSFQACAAKR